MSGTDARKGNHCKICRTVVPVARGKAWRAAAVGQGVPTHDAVGGTKQDPAEVPPHIEVERL